MTLLLGKLPATRPYGLRDLVAYSNGPLPSPPPSAEPPSFSDWNMFANGPDDSCTVPGAPFGDCVMAGAAHLIMASNSQVHREDPVPSSNDVANQYLTLTGGVDSGLNESDALAFWRSQGLFGDNRISAYVPVDPNQIPHVHASIAFYGTCFLGVQVPASAQDQFANEEPWTVVPGSPIEGGHCIVAVGYDQQWLYCVSWGRVVPVSWPWVQAYCDEGWCVISQEVAEAGAGPGGLLNLAALQKDLDAL